MKKFISALSSIESELTFRTSVAPLPVHEITGFDPTDELSEFSVFADDEFNIGTAWYCIDRVSGCVFRVSPEFGSAPEFVNSSMQAFDASLRAAAEWSSESETGAIRLRPESVDLLEDALAKIDRKALASGKHEWAAKIDLIRLDATDDEAVFFFKIEE